MQLPFAAASMNRRQYLTTAGAAIATAGLAGCAGILEEATGGSSEPKHEYVADAWSNQESESGATAGAATADVELDTGEYTAETWDPGQPIATQIEARDRNENEFEVFVVDEREFEDRVRDGESARYYNNLQGEGRFIQVQGVLQPGSYRIVIDNSEYGHVSPGGSIDVEIAVLIERA